MASKLPGKGTTLSIYISSASSYQPIASRVKITGPKPKLGIRKVTTLDSTYEDKRPSIPDLGQVNFSLFYDPNDATHILVRDKLYTPPSTPNMFKLALVDGMTTPANEVFEGFITEWERNGMEVEGTLGADVVIELTDSNARNAGA